MGCGSSKGNTVNENAHRPSVKDRSSPHPENDVTSGPTKEKGGSVPTETYTDAEPVEDFDAFVEFPTPMLLAKANRNYAKLGRSLPYTDDGNMLPYPTPTTKRSIFDVKKFEALDNFAVSVDVKYYQKSLKEFTDFLTGKYTSDQLSMARVIFRWLAAQDIEKHATLQTACSESSVLWHLRRLKDNSGYYCNLFRDMCRCAGLQVEKITGYAKHAHLEPGEDPKAGDQNSWVGVVINNEWRIVDAHWGSSHMVGTNPGEWLLIDDNGQGYRDVNKGPEKTTYAYDEVYFLTDPEQFIYSHIPSSNAEEKWQFLARPVTLREFTDMAYLKPAFFDLGLRLLEHRKCVLYASQGGIEIQIGTPAGGKRSFMYRLWMANEQSLDDIKLDRFCIMQQKNNILYCRIYFPMAGKFKIELFGRDSAPDQPDEESAYYKQVCAYIIHCDEPAEGVKAFPENTRREWGPGPDIETAGLRAITHEDALIEAEDGTAEVRFKMDKSVELLHQLHSNTRTREDLKNHVLHYMDEENGEVVLHIKLPESGDYALNLFAKDEGTEGKFPNVCSYIVSCENAAADVTPFPTITNGRLGRASGNNVVQLKLVSHDSPIITCPETGEISLAFRHNIPCDTITSLELHTRDGIVKKENFVWTSPVEDTINYNIRFPEPGVYTFDVFAKEVEKDGSYPKAFTCLINVPVPKEGCVPFPQAFAQWTQQCEILEPSGSVLAANSKVKFSVKIPHAYRVSIISSNGWTHLEKDENGYWVGEVETPGGGEELKLSAEVDEGSNSFSTLLQYKIEDAKDLKKEEEKLQEIQEAARKENEARKLAEQKEKERRKKEFEKVKEDLLRAIHSRDLDLLRKCLKTVEQKKYVHRLSSNVEEARTLIKSLERIHKLKQAVLKMDQKTMLEIKNYANPPRLVHEVMIATLLVLGDAEQHTSEWSDCQKRLVTIGKDGLHRRVTSFDVTTLHPEIASRALQIIGRFRMDDVSDVSSGAGTFYAWAVGMIEELRVTERDAIRAPPANQKRQKEIFRGMPKKKTGRG